VTAADAPPRRGGRVGLLALVGILTAGGPLGVDTYLPALPQVAADLGSTAALAANTLTAYLIGLGVGQLVWGPVSDRIGRRRPLLIGLGLFILASLGCAAATDIWLLLTARVIAGLAGSSMIVLGRAIVRDLYEGEQLSRIFGRLQIVFGVAPVVGPLIGTGILAFSDWRGTFVGLAVLGAGLLIGCSLMVHETLPEERRVHGRETSRREAWLMPFRSGYFLLNAFILLGASTAMLMYITFVSFVLQVERGIPNWLFGVMFACSAIGVILGGQIGPFFTRRFSPQGVLRTATAVNIVAAIGIAFAAALGWPTWLLYAFLILTVLMASTCQPLSVAQSLVPFTRGAGMAAAIAGSAQMAIGSLIPGLIAQFFGEHGVVLGIGQAVISAITLLVASIGAAALARRGSLRHGRPVIAG